MFSIKINAKNIKLNTTELKLQKHFLKNFKNNL